MFLAGPPVRPHGRKLEVPSVKPFRPINNTWRGADEAFHMMEEVWERIQDKMKQLEHRRSLKQQPRVDVDLERHMGLLQELWERIKSLVSSMLHSKAYGQEAGGKPREMRGLKKLWMTMWEKIRELEVLEVAEGQEEPLDGFNWHSREQEGLSTKDNSLTGYRPREHDRHPVNYRNHYGSKKYDPKDVTRYEHLGPRQKKYDENPHFNEYRKDPARHERPLFVDDGPRAEQPPGDYRVDPELISRYQKEFRRHQQESAEAALEHAPGGFPVAPPQYAPDDGGGGEDRDPDDYPFEYEEENHQHNRDMQQQHHQYRSGEENRRRREDVFSDNRGEERDNRKRKRGPPPPPLEHVDEELDPRLVPSGYGSHMPLNTLWVQMKDILARMMQRTKQELKKIPTEDQKTFRPHPRANRGHFEELQRERRREGPSGNGNRPPNFQAFGGARKAGSNRGPKLLSSSTGVNLINVSVPPITVQRTTPGSVVRLPATKEEYETMKMIESDTFDNKYNRAMAEWNKIAEGVKGN